MVVSLLQKNFFQYRGVNIFIEETRMSVTIEAHPARYVYIDGKCAGYFIYLEGSDCMAFKTIANSSYTFKQQDLSDIIDLLNIENSKL